MSAQRTILITGGAGALGSVLAKRYIEEGHRVICVDNLMKTQDTRNIDTLLHHRNFRFVKHDIVEPLDLRDEKIDWIFNFACPVSVISLQVDPIHTMKTSVHGVINMLDLARAHGARILQGSTADVYGEMKEHPFKETDWGSTNSLSARACYENGKRAAETLFMDYRRKYGVDIRIARIFNTAGPATQLTDGRVPSIFIYNALGNRDISIYGDGSQTRCLLHVNDQIDGLDKLMRTEHFIGPVNIGSDTEITMLGLAKMIIEKTGSKSKLVFEPPDDAPLFRKPDISLAKQTLQWEPKISLDRLLDDMIAHYRSEGLPESRVLVFATTYYPDAGLAEERLAQLARDMPDTEFHIVTTRFRRGVKAFERTDNVFIYRLGLGVPADKYLLPVLGAFKARSLDRALKFRFMWSLMASYGAIAGVVLKMLGSRASFIIAHHASELYGGWKAKVASYAERKADHVYQGADMQGSDELLEQVRKKYQELTMRREGKLIRPV